MSAENLEKNEESLKKLKTDRAFGKKGWTSRLFFVIFPLDDVKRSTAKEILPTRTKSGVKLKK